MTIRIAIPGDLPALTAFEQAIIDAERPFDETLRKDPFHYYDFDKLIHSENTCVLVAETDNEILGSGFATIKDAEPYLRHSRYAYIGLMYVKPAYRGQGINRQILEQLKQWIQQKGISEIRLVVYSQNEQAVKAYQKTGFMPHVLEMRMEW